MNKISYFDFVYFLPEIYNNEDNCLKSQGFFVHCFFAISLYILAKGWSGVLVEESCGIINFSEQLSKQLTGVEPYIYKINQ